MLVYEENRTLRRESWLQRQYDFYTNDQIDQASLNEQKTSGNETETGSLSVIGRFNYGYKAKYLIEFASGMMAHIATIRIIAGIFPCCNSRLENIRRIVL